MYGYSPGGLVTKKRLTASGAQPLTVNTQQTYDNEGRVTGVTYPDMYQNLNGGVPFVFQAGKTYGFSYDTMGRPAGMSDSTVDWVKDILYGPASELTQIKFRNTASTLSSTDFYTETRTYNMRLQLTRLQSSNVNVGNLMDLEYRYSATQNNGQITQQKDWLSGEEVSYTYDNLQRLITAVTTGPEWGQSFSYDGFGNRTGAAVTKGAAPSSSFTIDAATNRVINSGFSYDANGNMLAGAGVTSAAYDVENRMVSVTGTGAEQYAYGATNKRIWKKKPNGDEEIYFYGIGGQKLVTYTKTVTYNLWEVQGGTNLYFGSRAIVLRGVTTTSDRLGSRGSYFPYGEEKQVTAQDKEKFATYYRDGTTGLDYAQNRYYANTLGRFSSPDPYAASGRRERPGSWNRYAYVGGDPINLGDPMGLEEMQICRDGYCYMTDVNQYCDVATNWDPSCWNSIEPQTVTVSEKYNPVEYDGSDSWFPAEFDLPFYTPTNDSVDNSRGSGGGTQPSSPKGPSEHSPTKPPLPSCVGIFFKEWANNMTPLLPGLISTGGEIAGSLITNFSWNQALRYAASAPSTILGTPGLLYPLKSSTFRNIMDISNKGSMIGLILNETAGGIAALMTEWAAITAGECQ